MTFEPAAFFDGFTKYLQVERAATLQFLAVTASFEHWIQFEAGAWLNQHGSAVGLDPGHWSVLLELSKGDTWLVNDTGSPNVSIEFKCIHNNKNCRSKVWELRRDLSEEKVLPAGFTSENTIRFGLAVLVYLRYLRDRDGGYQTLGGVVRDPWTAQRFLDYFRSESTSTDTWFGPLPQLRFCSEIVQAVSLEGAVGIDPNSPGSAVWLTLTTAAIPESLQ